MKIKLTSPAFEDGGEIPQLYTCDGDDISPPLEWSSIPEETRSLALVVDDPDAPMGIWVHWIVYDLPAESEGLDENILPERDLQSGAKQGMNDFQKIGYGGPCPPGGEHKYFFKLYALDTKIDLPSGIGKPHLMIAMEGHILAQANLMGRYSR